MSLELIATGFVMGLAGAGHCAVMCGSACAALGLGRGASAAPQPAVVQRAVPVVLHLQPRLQVQSEGALLSASAVSGGLRIATGPFNPVTPVQEIARAPWRDPALWAFLASRVVSYALGGAVVAASVAAFAALGQTFSALRPFWVLLQVAVVLLGLWLLATGRQPPALVAVTERLARRRASASALSTDGGAVPDAARSPVARAAAAGAAWVFLPCGLLQSALVTSALASTPLAGAGVMAAFALASSLGLLGAPALILMLRRFGPAGEQGVTRPAGALLAGAGAWALWMLSTAGLARALCVT